MSKIINHGKELILTAIAAVASGAVVLIGKVVGIAAQPIPAGTKGAVSIEGAATVTKKAGAAWTQGQRIYFNSATEDFGIVPTDDFAGIAAADATSAATSGSVILNVGVPSTFDKFASIADPGDEGAIPVSASGRVALVTEAAETRTLAAPTFAGQIITAEMKTDGGDAVLTCETQLNQAGNNTATFDDAGDVLALQAIEVGANLRWRVVGNDGVTVSTVGS